MQLQDIKNLATVSRIDMSDAEALGLSKDLAATLSYIDQVNNATLADQGPDIPENRNVCREDVVTTKTGEYTDLMLAQAVAVEDGFVKVAKIL